MEEGGFTFLEKYIKSIKPIHIVSLLLIICVVILVYNFWFLNFKKVVYNDGFEDGYQEGWRASQREFSLQYNLAGKLTLPIIRINGEVKDIIFEEVK